MTDKYITEAYIRKYRPQTLKEVLGQDAAVNNVKGFLKTGRIPQTLLIIGPTGSGKTTLARLIAAAINNWKGDTEKNPNLQEINVADKRTIDDIRSIIATSKFLPTGKFKVILLDEIHKLPSTSSSPLLKPLEEPHERLVWIMCTNEPEKLLDTIIQRATPIKLRPNTPDNLLPLLERITKEEKVKFGKKHESTLRKIAETGQGQTRKTLTLLQSTVNTYAITGDPVTALAQAVETLDSHSLEQVVQKILYGMYIGKQLIVLSALCDSEDSAGIVNVGLELNRYLLDLHVDTKNTYHSIPRVKFAKLLKEKLGKLPPVGHVLKVQETLVNVRERMNIYAVREDYLLQTTLPKVAALIGKAKSGE